MLKINQQRESFPASINLIIFYVLIPKYTLRSAFATYHQVLVRKQEQWHWPVLFWEFPGCHWPTKSGDVSPTWNWGFLWPLEGVFYTCFSNSLNVSYLYLHQLFLFLLPVICISFICFSLWQLRGSTAKYCILDIIDYCTHEFTAAMVTCIRPVQDDSNQYSTL